MMTAAPALDLKQLKIIALPSSSALADFHSGEDEIDRNLLKCCEWHSCYRSRVFCAYIPNDADPYGFYCLGLYAHDAKAVNDFFVRASDDARNFVPFIYLNYLAVREGWHRRKIGTVLLLNALERCSVVMRHIGLYGVALHALTDHSAALYDRYGFRSAKDGARQKYPMMVLPARSVLELFPERTP